MSHSNSIQVLSEVGRSKYIPKAAQGKFPNRSIVILFLFIGHAIPREGDVISFEYLTIIQALHNI